MKRTRILVILIIVLLLTVAALTAVVLLRKNNQAQDEKIAADFYGLQEEIQDYYDRAGFLPKDISSFDHYSASYAYLVSNDVDYKLCTVFNTSLITGIEGYKCLSYSVTAP